MEVITRKVQNRLKTYKTNPFHDSLVIKTKKKQVSVSRLGRDNNVLVNQDTGEINGTHIVTYKTVDDSEFIKLFTGNVAMAFDLTSAGIKAFTVMSFALQKQIAKDGLFIDELVLEDFLLENKNIKACSMKTIYRGISELEKSKILAKSTRSGYYFINPNFVFNGDRVAFTTTLQRQKRNEDAQQELALEN